MQGPLGNATWSRSTGIARSYAMDGTHFFFGCPVNARNLTIYENFLSYGASGHFLTVAGTRAGKGVSQIIPNLLCYRGSAVVIDPKGENAWITTPRRRSFGQQVRIVDPWGEVNKRYGSQVGVEEEVACFNPLSVLKAGSEDFIDHLAYLADALIITQSTKDPFWDDTARELWAGLMAFVVENPAYSPYASLTLVRQLLMKSNEELQRTINAAVDLGTESYAARKLGQFENKEKITSIPSVIAAARTQTAFLDSPALTRNMAASDFSFDDLRQGGRPTTVYLVLPPDKLETYARWLRLMVSISIGTVQKGALERKTEAEQITVGEEVKEWEPQLPPKKESSLPTIMPTTREEVLGGVEGDLAAHLSMAPPKLDPLKELILPGLGPLPFEESSEIVTPERMKVRQRADIEEWWAQQSLDVRQAAEKLHTNPADLARAKGVAYMMSIYSQKPGAADKPVGVPNVEPVTELSPSLQPTRPPSQAKKALSDAEEGWRAEEAARIASLPVLFLLDEFGTIGKLAAISKAYGLAAGLGMVIWAFVQDLNQLKRHYPDEWETFVGNINAMICFGIMDQFTCEYVSKMLGTETVRYETRGTTGTRTTRIRPPTMEDIISRMFGETVSLEEDAGGSTSETTTPHVVAQPLASADLIRRMHSQKSIVIGHGDPAVCERVDYYRDPTFSSWARPDPKYQKR